MYSEDAGIKLLVDGGTEQLVAYERFRFLLGGIYLGFNLFASYLNFSFQGVVINFSVVNFYGDVVHGG